MDKLFESLFFLSLFSMIEIHTIIILQEVIVMFYSILSQQLIFLKLLGFTPRSFNILEQMKIGMIMCSSQHDVIREHYSGKFHDFENKLELGNVQLLIWAPRIFDLNYNINKYMDMCFRKSKTLYFTAKLHLLQQL